MCSLCGALGRGPSWEREGALGEDARWLLQREAAASARCLTELMRDRRIRVTADPRSGFVVRFPTGAVETAGGIADVWHILQRRGVAVPDPLCPA